MMNSVAIAAGGGVRVGLEDNIWFDPKRSRLAANLELIRRVHRIIEFNEREVMKPQELRKLLKLEAGHGSYGRK
jgi:3-keto-5-aminohexanoate cleavage enzyme